MKRSLFDFAKAKEAKGGSTESEKKAKITPQLSLISAEQILRPPDLTFLTSLPSQIQTHQTQIQDTLLIDIVRPKTLNTVLGHVDAKKSILQYLNSPTTRTKPALLLSGPSGCGKTLLASLAIQEALYQRWDDRILDLSKESDDSISVAIENLSRKKSLSGKPWCALIECIEGFSGEERTSLLKAVKASKIAMILTCDDAFEPANKPFREACFHVRMGQNDSNTILRILFKAGEVYGLKLSPETASSILINSNQNVRLALNTLQLLATTKKTARKGAPLSSADEAFNLFTSCSQMCAATPKSFERSLVISSGDSDMFVSLLQQNYVSSTSFPAGSQKTLDSLSNVAEAFSFSDIFMKRFLIEEGTYIATLSTKINLTLQKPEKQSLFPLCFSIMSSSKSRKDRLPVAAGVLSYKFLGEERPLFIQGEKNKDNKNKKTKKPNSSFVQDILPNSNLTLLSQIRPSGLDAHDTLLVLKARVNGRSDFRVLKGEGLYVVGDAQANTWIQKGVFAF
jgi:hypothetical protein